MEDKLPTIRREEVKHSPPPRQAQFDTLSQEVAEEGQSVVQLHLFVVESQWEGHGARNVPAQTQSQDPPQGQAQAHAVVPDTVKTNIVLRVFKSSRVLWGRRLDVLMWVKRLIQGQFSNNYKNWCKEPHVFIRFVSVMW